MVYLFNYFHNMLSKENLEIIIAWLLYSFNIFTV